MRAPIRPFTLVFAVLLALAGTAEAQGRHGGRGGYGSGHAGAGHYGHGHPGWRHGGPAWGGVGVGIGLGFALGFPAWYGAPWYPAYAAPLYATRSPVYEIASPPPPLPAVPEPIVYPRNGQSPAQTEADRRACDRWAMTQPSAMADASVFQRATLACMDGRGYTLR